jgi:hypothetical protein
MFSVNATMHELRTPRKEIVFTARPKIHSHSKIFMYGQKFTHNPKFVCMAEAYFVCHIGPIFQISLIYAFIGCP